MAECTGPLLCWLSLLYARVMSCRIIVLYRFGDFGWCDSNGVSAPASAFASASARMRSLQRSAARCQAVLRCTAAAALRQ